MFQWSGYPSENEHRRTQFIIVLLRQAAVVKGIFYVFAEATTRN